MGQSSIQTFKHTHGGVYRVALQLKTSKYTSHQFLAMMSVFKNKNAKPSVSAIAYCPEGFKEDFGIFGILEIIGNFRIMRIFGQN